MDRSFRLRSVQHLGTNKYDKREEPSYKVSNNLTWPVAIEFFPRRDNLGLEKDLLHPATADNGTIRVVPCEWLATEVSARLEWIYLGGSNVPNAANQQCILPRGADHAA